MVTASTSVTTLSSAGRSRRRSSRSTGGSVGTRLDPVPEGTNLVLLRGSVLRDPVERVLPSGDSMLTFDLTVRPPGGAAESMPVVWFDPPAAAAQIVEGSDAVVVGRVRRRFFRVAGATATRTEVLAERVIRATSTARVTAAVHGALADLAVE